MDRSAILQIVEAYFKETKPGVNFSDLAHIPVPDILTSSLDVIEFLMHLEDVLGVEEEIDLEAIGPAFARRITFSELAEEVVRYLEART